jgi:hypothetical protein
LTVNHSFSGLRLIVRQHRGKLRPIGCGEDAQCIR